jgi:DNA-binding CsgD family transcriptional regulator
MKLGGIMNGRKNLAIIHHSEPEFRIHPEAYILFDKRTGTQRFEVKANTNGSLPVDHIASLLAAQCVLRGARPQDFGLAVKAGEGLLSGLQTLAERFVQDCQMFQPPVRLSGREREILHEVLQVSSNKEIAEKMHISVRTVKFHVSALLVKFGVAGRMDLMRKTFDFFSESQNSIEMAKPLVMTDPKLRDVPDGGNAGDGRATLTALERRSRS